MRAGVIILPDRPWSDARRDWELAESLGCDHAWTFDHLTMGEHSTARWHAAMPTLAAAALATHHMRVGVLVATPHLHHPVTLAHELVTLDSISHGRFVAGLGSGGGGPDAMAARAERLTVGERVGRFEEFIEVLTGMLAGGVNSHCGQYYEVGRAELRLRPVAGSLPLVVAATGPRAMRIAARLGAGWVTNCAEDDLEHQAQLFDSIDPSRTLDRVLQVSSRWRDSLDSAESLVELAERSGSLGFTDLVVPFRGGDRPLRGWLSKR
jgi:alkanesulfonate monooxygenase SsuD/methylene tetrahydromethanopterin reductase-like flavin-dependent oxidoreductase (luciferase family)